MELLELGTIQWAGLVAAALIVGLTKAGFGAGAGILSVPLTAIALGGSAHMLPVMLPLLICGDVFSIIHYPRERNWRILRMLVPGCLAGVALGWVLLRWITRQPEPGAGQGGSPSDILDPIIGGVCLFFVAVQLWRYFRESRLTERPLPYRPKVWHGVSLGIVAGATSTLAHAAGSLIALFIAADTCGPARSPCEPAHIFRRRNAASPSGSSEPMLIRLKRNKPCGRLKATLTQS